MAAVLVLNPGTHPEPLHAGRGMAGLGLATEMWTAARFSRSHPLYRAAQFNRRSRDAMASREVASTPNFDVRTSGAAFEVAFMVAQKFAPPASPRLLSLRNQNLIAAVNRHVATSQETGGIIIAQQKSALEVFRAAGDGTFKVLNYPIAHHRWMAEYLANEALENPSWSQDMQGHAVSARWTDRLDEEIARADMVLVASTFVRRTFLQAGIRPEKIRVRGLGVDDSAAPTQLVHRDEIHPRKLRLLFAGQVNQRKGVSYLVDAIRALPLSDLEVTAAGPVTESIRHLIPGYVRLTGAVSRAHMQRLYDWSDVVLLPSLAEGFGLTALEAMARGRAVIVSSHTFGEDIITTGVDGFVVPPRDSEALVRILHAILEGKYDLTRMGDAARHVAKAQTWDDYAETVSRTILDAAEAFGSDTR